MLPLAEITMRTGIAALISIFMCALLSAQGAVQPAFQSEIYTINQSAPHSDPVAFSIGYPRGWTKSENTTMASDNLGDLASPRDHELVCAFMSPLDPLASLDPRTIRIITNYASITIFRGYSASAKDEAEHLAASRRRMGDEVQRVIPVKTRAGDTGYLLMSSDEIPQGHRLSSEFFFHVGSKGNIRISIYASGTFLELHETLQKLVLESLRFPGG